MSAPGNAVRYFNTVECSSDEAVFRIDLSARVGDGAPVHQLRLYVGPKLMRQLVGLVAGQVTAQSAAGSIRVSRRGTPPPTPTSDATRSCFPNKVRITRAVDGTWFIHFALVLRRRAWRAAEVLDHVEAVTTAAEAPWIQATLEAALKDWDARYGGQARP